MSHVVRISRRGFLGGVFSAGALVLAAQVRPTKALGTPAAAEGAAAAWSPSVYLGIEPTGTVIIVAHRSEMGTGIRTALPMVAADALDADWQRVKIEQAPGDPKYGDQNTDGSKSIRDFYDALRQAGATGRLMLERAAAATWGVPVSQCQAFNHQIIHVPSGRSLGYGELAPLAAQQPVPKKDELRFKSPAEFRYIGIGMPIVDLDAICTGKATYGIDAQMPGMVYASIARSPVIGGTLKAYDDQEARQVRGVQQTVVIPPAKPPYAFQALGGVAVIADSTWAAMQGRQKLKVEWDPGENASYDSEAYKRSLFETAEKPQKVVHNVGDVDAVFARASQTHEAEYYVPLLAHTPMEPPAAVAEYKDGKVVAWAATQNPQAVQATVASALGIRKQDVICHVTLLGGGFGRKSKPDYVAEAALLSKQVGKPVKVAWSREDDVHFGYYNAVAAMYMKAAIGADGKPTAWLQRSVFPPITSLFDVNAVYGDPPHLGQGWVDVPFDIPNLRVENGPAKAHVRIGWLRSVANIYHGFAIQSFLDELAAAAGRDRVEYFLEVLGRPRQIDYRGEGTINADYNYGKPLDQYPVDTGRLRRVVEVVAERSGWAHKRSGKGHAFGFAAHRSFLSYVAAVVEVEVDDQGQVRIPRVDLAVDAGLVVHPERVQAQGQIQQSNFQDYPVAADQRGARCDACVPRPERCVADRGGRAWRAADDPGDLQRHIRRHRETHSPAPSQKHQIDLIPASPSWDGNNSIGGKEMPQHNGEVRLKRDTYSGGRHAGVSATMQRAVKRRAPCSFPARCITLLAVLVFVGLAVAGTPGRAAEQDAGAQTFQEHCAMCHGPDGHGDTVIGKSARIPDLHSAAVQQQSDAALAEFIANGKGMMPPFKNSLSSEQIQAVVGYIRALAQKH